MGYGIKGGLAVMCDLLQQIKRLKRGHLYTFILRAAII